MWTEVRVAFRSLSKARGFTVAAVAVIALCIAANTAIFGIVNAVLWKPMNFVAPERIVSISERFGTLHADGGSFSAPDYLFLASHSRSFTSMAAYNTREFELSGSDRPDRVTGARVTASLFPLLGVAPQMGRTFTTEEDMHSRHVAVLSDVAWRAAFGASPKIVGRTIYLDREPYTVIGVMPPAFVFPLRHPGSNGLPADIYVPMSWIPLERQFGYMVNKGVIARLNPGVTLHQAASEVNAIMKRSEDQYPAPFRSQPDFALSGVVVPYSELITGKLETIMLVLLSAAGLVLLIGCANVANLLLARSVQRRREFAVRCALGAAKWRIVRQTLLESLLLSCGAGAVGVALATWLSPQLVRLIPAEVPRLNEVALDGHALLFALSICCLMPLLFGLAPAFEASRTEIAHVLREGGRGGTQSVRQRGWMSMAVVAQYALAVLLVVTSGLLMRSFVRLRQVDPGFERAHVLSLAVKLPSAS
jgi:putative ABC transport system permease protein